MVTGYDQAVALPALQAGDDSSLFKENNKKFDVGTGSLELKVRPFTRSYLPALGTHLLPSTFLPRRSSGYLVILFHMTEVLLSFALAAAPLPCFLQVTTVNAELGEIGGVFVQKQPSDTDLGSKQPKEVLLKGEWFATVQ